MKLWTLILVGLFCSTKIISQDNCVRDPNLEKELYSYLITRITDYYIDSKGKHIPATDEYDGTCINSRNLKTDSIINDKSLIGVYSTNFACMDCGSTTELYLQYMNKREFIDLSDKKIQYKKILEQVETFFKLYPNEFTDLEKITTLKNVLEILRD